MCTGNGTAPGSVAEALRMAHASLDYLNGRATGELDAAGFRGVLIALGEVQAKTAVGCDVHHQTHQHDGGPTSVTNCGLFCQTHHDIFIHCLGWQVIRHPDGTSQARSPDGKLILHSHAPPTRRAS
ncbi:MAG TPA: hypothetical protein VH589_15685 [Trebonia sp.]